MTNDLISRSALLAQMDKRLDRLQKTYGEHDAYASGFESGIIFVDAAPAVDAVEVVRCENCKHLWKRNMLCVHPKRMHGMVAVSECEKDGFCSYGERK